MSVAKTELVACPNCGHSAYCHWKIKGGVWDDATKGQDPHILHKSMGIQDGEWVLNIGEYPPNGSPGALSNTSGCFQAIGEYFTGNLHDPSITWQNWGWNYYKFCDCPIDRDTVLALIRQGKTFTGTLEDDLENPPTQDWPKQALDFAHNTPVPEIPEPKPPEPELVKKEEPEKVPDDAPPHFKPAKPSIWRRIWDVITS